MPLAVHPALRDLRVARESRDRVRHGSATPLSAPVGTRFRERAFDRPRRTSGCFVVKMFDSARGANDVNTTVGVGVHFLDDLVERSAMDRRARSEIVPTSFSDLKCKMFRSHPRNPIRSWSRFVPPRSTADLKVLQHKDGGKPCLHASAVFPLILGYDFSGVVAEIGRKAGSHKVGDEIYGFLPYARSTRNGTYAEFVAVGAATAGPKAKAVSHEQAAASATSAATALQVLRDKHAITPASSVLVNGASGGVGYYAVQSQRRSARQLAQPRAPGSRRSHGGRGPCVGLQGHAAENDRREVRSRI